MSFSIFDRLLAGTDGTMWVRRFPNSESAERKWEGYEPDGTRRMEITIPAGLDVREVGRHFVVVSRQSEADDMPVILYDLRQPPPSP